MTRRDERDRWLRREDLWPLGATGFLLLVTAVWWGFALWPLPSRAPAWLERARYVCFNVTESGLPDRSGWILLIGQPLGLAALLMVGWPGRVRGTLRHLTASAAGRTVLGALTLLVAGGLGAAGVRVADARVPEASLPAAGVSADYPRLDRPLPAMAGLVDQRGQAFSLDVLQGRRALVTFAYAHCATVCPLLVRNALAARDEVKEERDLALVVLTLDPWRDTPSRLADMAAVWGLADGDVVLSGSVADVEAALDAWGVARARDERTGDITHPALTYLMEADGTVAYASTGARAQLVELARRLR